MTYAQTIKHFQHHYSSVSHDPLRNHFNILICWFRNISYYYQWWKWLCCL